MMAERNETAAVQSFLPAPLLSRLVVVRHKYVSQRDGGALKRRWPSR
jgi:hypothetical protein